MSSAPAEPEFQQAYNDLVSSLENSTLFTQKPSYRTALKVLVEPETIAQFRVVWDDDNGNSQVNRGYRIHYNTALGACKGGIRFHPSVNISVLKFLGLGQVFKNALTGLGLGGAKGGADFDPKGKSDNEIRRFCQAFMTQLKSYVGVHIDIPGGDIGVSEKEIGWLFGQYKLLCKSSEGVLTGKGLTWGGSHGRKEAAGYGLVYYVEEMIRHRSAGEGSFEGQRVAISGSGNVATGAAAKVIELGGKVISLSDSQGTIIALGSGTIGLYTLATVAEHKALRKPLADLASELKDIKYIPGERPWKHVEKVDIALPCATQNELSGDEAKALVAAGCKYVAEGSNMGCTAEAGEYFENHRKQNGKDCVWFAPGKGANAGGVAVSGLEVSQNCTRETWSAEKVDMKLRNIMRGCFQNGLSTAAKYTEVKGDELPSLVVGTNIAGFVIVADAMHAQGQWWE